MVQPSRGRAEQPRAWAHLGWGMGGSDPGPEALYVHASPLPGLITATQTPRPRAPAPNPALGAASSGRAEQGPELENVTNKIEGL